MTENVLQVLTFKSIETILATGGTQSWALDRSRAKACKYVVCCRNANTRDSEGNEAHGSAFIVGIINDVIPSTETRDRWLVRFKEYALINVGDQWEGRNPVRFYTVEDYKGYIDFDALDWMPMPDSHWKPEAGAITPLTIREAKLALAETFAVDPTAIEITIRG